MTNSIAKSTDYRVPDHLKSNLDCGPRVIKFYFILISFVLGLILSQKVIVGGEVYVGEIIAVVYGVLNFKWRKFSGLERNFFRLSVLWAAAQLVSDLVNGIFLLDSIKGVAAPLVFSWTTLSLIWYFRKDIKRMPSFLFGCAIGSLLLVVFYPNAYGQDNPWKWGLGAGFISLFAIINSFFQRSRNNLILFLVIALFFVVSLWFDARSLAIFPLIAMVAYWLQKPGKKTRFSKMFGGEWGGAKLLFVIIPSLFLVNFLLSFTLSSDLVLSNFSQDAAEKYKVQANGTYGLLLGGRSEILISSRAFFDSPLVGHGSWAKDPAGRYINEYISVISQLGYEFDPGVYELGLIPAHSYLMGALVWAGIFGGLFWLYLLNKVVKSFIEFMPYLPYYFYLGVLLFVWNVFFSPFGADARWNTALFLAAFLTYTENLKIGRS